MLLYKLEDYMTKKINKKIKIIIKLIIIVVLVLVGIFVGNFAYGKFVKHKFKKILKENDSSNYELIQFANDEETDVWVRDEKLLSKNESSIIWESELDSKRIVMDSNAQIAIITEGDENLQVNTLNYTYINDFFENSNQSFKYLGKEDGYYILEFTNKKTKLITTLYLNIETNIVDKMIESRNGIDFETNFEVKINSVSSSEVEIPDLTDYHVEDSVSSSSVK
jgi:amino acid permease